MSVVDSPRQLELTFYNLIIISIISISKFLTSRAGIVNVNIYQQPSAIYQYISNIEMSAISISNILPHLSSVNNVWNQWQETTEAVAAVRIPVFQFSLKRENEVKTFHAN